MCLLDGAEIRVPFEMGHINRKQVLEEVVAWLKCEGHYMAPDEDCADDRMLLGAPEASPLATDDSSDGTANAKETTEESTGRTVPCFSVKPPWTELIQFQGKDVENRPKPWPHRGWILLHASKTDDSGGVDSYELFDRQTTGKGVFEF